MTPEQELASALGALPTTKMEKLSASFENLSVGELETILKEGGESFVDEAATEISQTEKLAEAQKLILMADGWGRELAKEAFSVTREGHDFDADRAGIRGEAAAKEMELSQRHHAMGSSKRMGNIGRALRFGPNAYNDPRHHAYVEKKHREGKNAWNPIGGALTPTKYEKGGTTLQYGEHHTDHKFTSKDSRPKEKKSQVDIEKVALGLPSGVGSAVTKGVGKAMGALTTSTGVKRGLIGAGVGAAAGAMKDPGQGGSRLGNMAMGAGLGAGAGVAAGPLARAAGSMNNRAGRFLGGAQKSVAKGVGGATGNPAAYKAAKEMQAARISTAKGQKMNPMAGGAKSTAPAATNAVPLQNPAANPKTASVDLRLIAEDMRSRCGA